MGELNNLRQTDFHDYGFNSANYAYAAPAFIAQSYVQSYPGSAGNSFSYNQNFATSIGNPVRNTIGTMFRRKSVTTTTTTTATTSTTTTSTTPAPVGDCYDDGKLALYSKTYHRGDQLELNNSQPDLADQQFDQTAVSALVTGSCCWELYSGTNYSGDQITVRPGSQYRGVTSLGN